MARPDKYIHDGVEVPSVTTVLEAAYPDGYRDGLLYWAERLGRSGRSWYDEREQKGRGGSYVHAIVEAYLQGRPPPAPTNALSQDTYSAALTTAVAICQWISAQRLDPIIGLEQPLTCATYGGTADLVTCSPTTLTVRDWKTGKYPPIHKWRAQLAAYAALWTAHGAQRERIVLEAVHCPLGTSKVEVDRIEGEDVIMAGRRWLAVLHAYRECLL